MLIVGKGKTNIPKSGDHVDIGYKEDIPLSLWPYLMERANCTDWGGSTSSIGDNQSYAADIIHCLIQGPVLFENPNIPL